MCVNLFFIIVWREEAYNSTRNNGKNVDKKSAQLIFLKKKENNK